MCLYINVSACASERGSEREREGEREREREGSFAENDLELRVALLHPQTHKNLDNKLGKNIYMHMESYCRLGCGI